VSRAMSHPPTLLARTRQEKTSGCGEGTSECGQTPRGEF
jgi:hypothetical protein